MEADARITDVLHTLDDPVEYARGIVVNFGAYPFDKKVAVVRIGVTGKGTFPNYRIEQSCESMSNTRKVGVAMLELSKNIELRHYFNGRSHQAVLADSIISEKWSSASMKLAEVQALLGQLGSDRKTRD